MDMRKFEKTFPHLTADDASKAVFADRVGRQVRYKVPASGLEREDFIHRHGTICVDTIFTIVGVQKNWRGDICFHATCGVDDFGRCISPDLVEFV